VAVAPQTVEGLDERRLDQVLDVGGTSNDPADDAPDHRRVTPDLLGQSDRGRVRRRGRCHASHAARGGGRLYRAHVVSAVIRGRARWWLVRPTDEAVLLRQLLARSVDRSIAKRDDAAVAGALSYARVDGSWGRSVGPFVAVRRMSACDREQAGRREQQDRDSGQVHDRPSDAPAMPGLCVHVRLVLRRSDAPMEVRRAADPASALQHPHRRDRRAPATRSPRRWHHRCSRNLEPTAWTTSLWRTPCCRAIGGHRQKLGFASPRWCGE